MVRVVAARLDLRCHCANLAVRAADPSHAGPHRWLHQSPRSADYPQALAPHLNNLRIAGLDNLRTDTTTSGSGRIESFQAARRGGAISRSNASKSAAMAGTLSARRLCHSGFPSTTASISSSVWLTMIFLGRQRSWSGISDSKICRFAVGRYRR